MVLPSALGRKTYRRKKSTWRNRNLHGAEGHKSCVARVRLLPLTTGGPIRTFFVSLLGAAALAAGFVLLNQKGPHPLPKKRDIHAGESQSGTISLERLRELGY